MLVQQVSECLFLIRVQRVIQRAGVEWLNHFAILLLDVVAKVETGRRLDYEVRYIKKRIGTPSQANLFGDGLNACGFSDERQVDVG